jgi:hypothetical protein
VAIYLSAIDHATGVLRWLTMTRFRVANFRLNRAAEGHAVWLATVFNRESDRVGARVRRADYGAFQLDRR